MPPQAVAMPCELKRFNWAAFLFPVGWALFEGPRIWALVFAVLGTLAGVGFVFIGVQASSSVFVLALLAAQLWYGFNANRLIWDRRPAGLSVEDLLRTQRRWTIGVLAVLAVIVVASLASGAFGGHGLATWLDRVSVPNN